MPEHYKLEQEIEALAQNLHIELRKPERQGMPHKEVLRETLREHVYPQSFAPSANAAPPMSSSEKKEDVESEFLPHYVQTAPPAVKFKVEQLIDRVWHEGIVKAAEEAAKEGPYFLDAFHDALTEKLYDEFRKRGILK